MLQCGRAVVGVENSDRDFILDPALLLQCGHAVVGVENGAEVNNVINVAVASMRPRRGRRGEQQHADFDRERWCCFNAATPWSAWRTRGMASAGSRQSYASMRPRRGRRGERGCFCLNRSRELLLQ